MDDRLWNTIEKSDKAEGFEAYLTQFPSGRHVVPAREKAESILIRAALKEQKIGLYKDFIEKYPDVKWSAEALDCVDWARAESIMTKRSMSDYLNKHPQGRFIERANENLKQIGSRPLTDQDRKALDVAAQAVAAACLEKLQNHYRVKIAINEEYPLNIDLWLIGKKIFENFRMVVGDSGVTGKIDFWEGVEGTNLEFQPSDEFLAMQKKLSEQQGGAAVYMPIPDNAPHVLTRGKVYCRVWLVVSGKTIQFMGDLRVTHSGVPAGVMHWVAAATAREVQGGAQDAMVYKFREGTRCMLDQEEFVYRNGEWEFLPPTYFSR
jgi:hypothetical protein